MVKWRQIQSLQVYELKPSEPHFSHLENGDIHAFSLHDVLSCAPEAPPTSSQEPTLCVPSPLHDVLLVA